MRIFQRAAPRGAEPSLTDLLAAIEERLFVLTPAAIRKAAARHASPTWCCALVFDGSLSQCLPPELALATVAEREAALAGSGLAGRALVWRATAFDGMGAAFYQEARLAAACDQANQVMQRRDTSLPAQELLLRLARRLNERSRTRFGNVAPEFVVYAFDLNRVPRALIAKSITAEQRTLLRRLRIL